MANDFGGFGQYFSGTSEFVDAKIAILGVGGGGNNAVDRMIEEGNIDDVKFVAVNTDVNVLAASKAQIKVQIGKKETRGLGAGAKPEVGAKSAEENMDEIANVLSDVDVLFITAGMGGGTGTGAAPIIAKWAKDKGILTIAVVSKPFTFEGARKMRIAEAGIEELKANVDSLIIVPNNNIFKVFKDKASVKECFKKADEILMQSVGGIYDIIKKCGDINVDFNDIRTIMSNRGIIHMGVGFGKGEDRFKQALARATQNQLLETTIDGARAILVQYYGDKLDMIEISNCGEEIYAKADPNVELIFGTREPEEDREDLRDFVMITIIAADFAPADMSADVQDFSANTIGNAFTAPVVPQPQTAPVAPIIPTAPATPVAPVAPVAPTEPKIAQEQNPFMIPAAPIAPEKPQTNEDDSKIPSFLRRPR